MHCHIIYCQHTPHHIFYKAHFPGLHNEPVSTEGLDYLRIQGSDHWVVTMKADDPLSQKRICSVFR